MITNLTEQAKSQLIEQYVKYITTKQKIDNFSFVDRVKSFFAPSINDAVLKIVWELDKVEVYSIIMRNEPNNVESSVFFQHFLISAELIVYKIRRISNTLNKNYNSAMYVFLEKALKDIYNSFPNNIEWKDSDRTRFNRFVKFFQDYNKVAKEFNVAEFNLRNSKCSFMVNQ